MKPFLILGLLLSLILMPSVLAVTVDNTTVINTTNITLSFNGSQVYDSIVVLPDTVAFNTGGQWYNLTTSTDGQAVVTIYDWNSSSKHWSVREANNASVNFAVSGVPSFSDITVYKDGVPYKTIRQGSSSIISFLYSGYSGESHIVISSTALSEPDSVSISMHETIRDSLFNLAVPLIGLAIFTVLGVYIIRSTKTGKANPYDLTTIALGLLPILLLIILGVALLSVI